MKDPDVRMIPVEEALAIVLREASPLPEESVPVGEGTGRILAEEVRADSDQPPFRRAMMDGFAVRAEDLVTSPVELAIVEEIPAGVFPKRTLKPGQASRIMTGAPVPEGSDAVQMVEKTRPASGPDRVRILEPVAPGANIAPQGQEIRAGQAILTPGQRLTPPRVGLLASVGRARVQVRRLPRVAIAATGDELVEAGQVPELGQIRNSNGPALLSRVRQWGLPAVDLGIVRDDRRALQTALDQGLRSDLLLISGGVSMGVHDLVEDALAEAGVEVFFRKVAIRPGKPAVFGRKGSTLVFGLPGNPVSSLVVFEVLAAAALRTMLALPRPEGRHLEATLEELVVQRPGRTSYLPGCLSFAGHEVRVRPVPTTGSADLLAYSRADALLIVSPERDRIPAGENVRVLLLPDSSAA